MSDTTSTYDINERAFQYAVNAVVIHDRVQKQRRCAGWTMAKQFLRSASSIGANLEEARAAETRADFIHKCSIAQKEARESLYWLRLMAASNIIDHTVISPAISESREIIAIITTIGRNARRNADTSKKSP